LIKYQVSGKKAVRYQEEIDNYRDFRFEEPLVLTTLQPMGFFRLPNYDRVMNLAPKGFSDEYQQDTESGSYEEPPTITDKVVKIGNWIKGALDAPTSADNTLEQFKQKYLDILPECENLSDVINKIGKTLHNSGHRDRRTVGCLRGWVRRNGLPLPGEDQPEASE
jgi:hypothetical protein